MVGKVAGNSGQCTTYRAVLGALGYSAGTLPPGERFV